MAFGWEKWRRQNIRPVRFMFLGSGWGETIFHFLVESRRFDLNPPAESFRNPIEFPIAFPEFECVSRKLKGGFSISDFLKIKSVIMLFGMSDFY